MGVRPFAGLMAFALLLSPALTAGRVPGEPEVVVLEADGVFSVDATFAVSEPASSVLAALTDYDQIARFMPEIQTSHVLERGDGRVVVVQEAVARFLLFSRRIYLTLEVHEGPRTLRFRDRSGKSFLRYEGAWELADRPGHTEVRYRLSATPAFDVPGFVLKRLLKRDALAMIARLSLEISARARAAPCR